MGKVCKTCKISKSENNFSKVQFPYTRRVCKKCEKNRRDMNKQVPELLERRRQYNRKSKAKLKKDPLKRLRWSLSTRLWLSLHTKGIKKSKKTMNLIGMGIIDLKKYLEERFDENMNWENYGSYWHVDHVIPLDSGKTEQEIYKLHHYTNFQPLEATENIIKSNKIL